MTELKGNNLLEIAAHIVAAYVQRNPVPIAGLPDLIASVSEAVGKLGGASRTEQPNLIPAVLTPAVHPKRSVLFGHIVCLEDGKEFTTLKKHLRVSHGLTPAEYRSKWGLPSDYPMVPPAYAAVRSGLAKASGLGHNRGKAKATRKPKAKQAV